MPGVKAWGTGTQQAFPVQSQVHLQQALPYSSHCRELGSPWVLTTSSGGWHVSKSVFN